MVPNCEQSLPYKINLCCLVTIGTGLSGAVIVFIVLISRRVNLKKRKRAPLENIEIWKCKITRQLS